MEFQDLHKMEKSRNAPFGPSLYLRLSAKLPQMIVYAVIATDSVAARGLVNGWCLPRSGRRDILSVAITAFIFIGVILRIIVI